MGLGTTPTLFAQERAAQERSDLNRQIRLKRDALRREELEMLRKSNPERAKRRAAYYERQVDMERIVDDYLAGKIPRRQARTRLLPLMREQITGTLDPDAEIAWIREAMARLEARLELMEDAKRDPDVLVLKQIDAILDSAQVNPDLPVF
ncbi:MAG TPA: hypothetical protein VGB20_03185 [bacterium]